eukprot:GHVU01055186.1.p2 GENE.GHVU01055186.1~~GHVU01055186.1.p2  ORF type:complete len:104 (-),score=9.21 GHVU01055186.1:397-708(-)
MNVILTLVSRLYNDKHETNRIYIIYFAITRSRITRARACGHSASQSVSDIASDRSIIDPSIHQPPSQSKGLLQADRQRDGGAARQPQHLSEAETLDEPLHAHT